MRLKICMIAWASVAFALAGCTTKPQAESTSPPPVVTPPPTSSSSVPVTSSILPGTEQDLTVNVGDTIHFGLNKYTIRDVDKPILQRQAEWLKRYPQVRVLIEGNCDERGTREYNLALGARRANAEKEYLEALGVAADRMETVSYGKERPVCTESNEQCWAQNRRGVTVVAPGATS